MTVPLNVTVAQDGVALQLLCPCCAPEIRYRNHAGSRKAVYE
jgi:hypothetical protein